MAAGPWEAYGAAQAPVADAPDGPWSQYKRDDSQPVIPPPVPMQPPSDGGNGGSPVGPQGGKQSIGDSLAGYAGEIRNGLTFGFGDNLSAAAATLPNMAVSALRGNDVGTVGENYNKLLSTDRKLTGDFSKEHPYIATGANVAGGAVSGGEIAKALPSVFGLSEGGNSILQGAKAGLTQGALFGAGGADDNNVVQGAAEGAGYGLAGGAILGPVAKAAEGFVSGLSGNAPKIGPTSDELRSMASKSYQTAADAGGVLKPEITNQFVDAAAALQPQTAAGKLIAGDNEVTNLSKRIQEGLKDKPLTLAEAQEIDEHLGGLVDGETTLGKVSKQGKQILDLQRTLRSSIENAQPSQIEGGAEGFEALKQGRELWAKSARTRDVENIINAAGMTDNPASSLRTGFRNLAKNPQRLRGYSDDEVAAIKNAAKTGIVTDSLRTFGSRVFPMIAASAGGASGGIPGAIAGGAVADAGSTLLRNAASSRQLGRAANALNTISAGSRAPTLAENLGTKARSAFGLNAPIEPPTGGSGLVGSGSATVNQAIQPQPEAAITRSPGVRLNSRPEVSAAIGATVLPAVVGTGMVAQAMSPGQRPNGPNGPLPPPPPSNSNVQNPQDFNHDDFLDTLSGGAESNGERNAKNPKSSALGPYQIIRSTFAGLVKKYDPETYQKGDFQALRSDPEYSKFIARKYSEENVAKLVDEGLPVNKTTAYLAWFADGKTAAKLLKSPANAPADSVFSSAALEANPFLKGKTVAQVVQWAQKKVNRA